AVAVVAQHENGALPAVEAIDCSGHLRAALAREEPLLGIRRVGRGCGARFVRTGDISSREPAIAAAARFLTIETAVDENSREPDLERPRLAIGADVREHAD